MTTTTINANTLAKLDKLAGDLDLNILDFIVALAENAHADEVAMRCEEFGGDERRALVALDRILSFGL
jgi:hypothetical protein